MILLSDALATISLEVIRTIVMAFLIGLLLVFLCGP
jgi:hypothetical protein